MLKKVWIDKQRVSFTTGEVAEICTAAKQTIIRNMDNGRLKSSRVDGSRTRFCSREDLLSFMQLERIPEDRLKQWERLRCPV